MATRPDASTPAPPVGAALAGNSPTPCSEQGGINYHLTWQAVGPNFFNDFDYIHDDANHGGAQYLPREEAVQKQVTVAHDTHAILRAGPKGKYLKRTSAKLRTKKAWTYFLMAMKYDHLPFGCGVWPSLWTTSPEEAWPNGGELDILEYVNEYPSRSSFHVGTANKCALDASELHRPGCPALEDVVYNFTKTGMHGHYDCVTDYPDHIGCAPNKAPLRSGKELSGQAGVVAVEWTASYLKVFIIPAFDIPADLSSDMPRPDDWDKWLVSYYPFGVSERSSPGSCPNPDQLMKSQQFVMNLNFCGDWGSKVWADSSCANTKGPAMPAQCVAVDPHNPQGHRLAGPRDCCTQFIYDEHDEFGTEAYLQQNAYFNISWWKVYQDGRRLKESADPASPYV